MNDCLCNFLKSSNIDIDIDFLNLFDSKSIVFISDSFGNVIYQDLFLNGEFNLNTNINLKNYVLNIDLKDFNLLNSLFQEISFDFNSKILNLYCIPYYLNINECIYFWLSLESNCLLSTNYSLYLNNLVFLNTALNNSCIIAITNKSGQITYVNDMFCKISKYNRDELLGKTHRIINSGYHCKSVFKDMWDTILNKEIWTGEICNKAKDGSLYWTNTTIIPHCDNNGKITHFISIRNDITNIRKKLENTINEDLSNEFLFNMKHLQNCLFKLKINNNNEFVIDILEGKIASKYKIDTYNNKNQRLIDVFPISFYNSIEKYISDCFILRKDIEFEVSYNQNSFLINLSPIYINDCFDSIVGSVLDISDLKEKENEIVNLAYFDSLTGLANRSIFKEYVNNEVLYCDEHNLRFALLFLDLDRFKYINDLFGHSVGDEVLIEVSKRLKSYLRSEDCIGRFGGDEFLILIRDIDSILNLENYINGILNCFCDSFNLPVSNLELSTNTSIGISIYPENGITYDDLIKKADTAMYQSKEKGKNIYTFYDENIHKAFERRVLIESELKNGIEKNEFLLYLQPKINSVNNEILGAEALIRWNNNKLGFVSPYEFIPIAEETGLINEIGSWVLKESIKKLYEWNNLKGLNKSISVNISVNQLINNRFISELECFLNEYPINTSYLELEITESIMLNFNEVKPIFDILKDKEIILSIDDFGTGYSSLTYLSNLSIDYLKIDQSFVRNLSDVNKSIIKTIINLAHNMNIKTVAEGVESKEHVDFLLSEHCDYFQGYYFSKPVDISFFEDKLLNLSI